MSWVKKKDIRETTGPDPEHTVIGTHWRKVLSVGTHRYSLASRGHGPFLVLKVWDTRDAATPRAGVELEPEQVRDLVDALRGWMEEESA